VRRGEPQFELFESGGFKDSFLFPRHAAARVEAKECS